MAIIKKTKPSAVVGMGKFNAGTMEISVQISQKPTKETAI